MPKHFHLVLWPREDDELSIFMRRLAMTHPQRWHAHHGSAGTGHLYQGRFKSFPVQTDDHFLTLCRYVERNPLRANLVGRAEDWNWCSLGARRTKPDADRPELTAWPIERPRNGTARVNRAFGAEEDEAVIRSILRGQPFWAAEWQTEVAVRLGLESAFRPRGRPHKQHENGSFERP